MATTVKARKVWAEADLQALPHDRRNYELVDGELVMSPKNNFAHGDLCARLLAALVHFNQHHHLGVVLDSSTGFWMSNRNCRAPDISFVSRPRMKQAGFSRRTTRFFPGGPDLAVEVLAPSNTPGDIDDRLEDFFSSGTRLVWIVRPDERRVEVCHSPDDRQRPGADACLDGEDVLPGFRLPLCELFLPEDDV